MKRPAELPLLTGDLPGTGGAPRDPEDFRVDELPAYLPGGSGEHCFARVWKRGLTTPQAIARICRALSIPAKDVGHAGLKDKHAVTTQWLSFPRVQPGRLLQIDEDDLRVLEAALHRNKLRTGHLRGNRFDIVLRGLRTTGDFDPIALAREVVGRLARCGMPDYFGPQRFGAGGDNAAQGLALLKGQPRGRDRRQHRLLISALQAQLFNEVLADRLQAAEPGRALQTLLGGEVLQRADRPGAFLVSEEVGRDQARVDAGELSITGPICGPRMPRPADGSPARAREDAVFARHQVQPEDFARLGRIARGGRRPLAVRPQQVEVAPGPEPCTLRLAFVLPPGAYATIFVRELTKASTG